MGRIEPQRVVRDTRLGTHLNEPGRVGRDQTQACAGYQRILGRQHRRVNPLPQLIKQKELEIHIVGIRIFEHDLLASLQLNLIHIGFVSDRTKAALGPRRGHKPADDCRCDNHLGLVGIIVPDRGCFRVVRVGIDAIQRLRGDHARHNEGLGSIAPTAHTR